jgi:hypothetical protein
MNKCGMLKKKKTFTIYFSTCEYTNITCFIITKLGKWGVYNKTNNRMNSKN